MNKTPSSKSNLPSSISEEGSQYLNVKWWAFADGVIVYCKFCKCRFYFKRPMDDYKFFKMLLNYHEFGHCVDPR